MKRIAERVTDSPFHVTCPFCGHLCDRTAALAWCASCYVEYHTNRDGESVFDTARKTPRFAFAKALAKSGGIAINAAEPEGEK